MRLFEGLSIRNKVLVTMLGAALATQVLLGALVLWADSRAIGRQAIDGALMNTALVAEYAVSALVFGDVEGGRSILDKARMVPAMVGATIYDSTGRAFASSGDTTRPWYRSTLQGDRMRAGHVIGGGNLIVTVPVRYEGELYGHVRLVSSLRPMRLRLLRHAMFVGVLMVLVALLAVALTVWLERFISRPILELSNITERITRDADFTCTLDSRRRDEVGLLYRSFGRLLDRIREKQAQRDAAEQALRASETRVRAMLDGLPDVLLTVDKDCRFTAVDGSRAQLYMPPEEVLGKRVGEALPPGSASNAEQTVRKAIATQKVERFEYMVDIAEEQKRFEARVIPLGTDEALTLVRDVTEQRRAQGQLVQSQKMETVGTLASGLAHDFNNVLAGISSSVYLLEMILGEEGDASSEEVKEALGVIGTATQRAGGIVQQLLSFTRTHDTTRELVDLNAVLADVRVICANTIDKSVALQFRPADEPAVVSADRTHMQQVLLNLCVNAEHAMTIMRRPDQRRGGTLEVAVELQTADCAMTAARPNVRTGARYWCVRVSDTGVGMSDALVARVFDPFFSTKDKMHGSGLGLAMTYRIIEEHSGFVDVHSEEGAGSTFSVCIPSATPAKPPASSTREQSRAGCGGGAILIIDDEEIVRSSTSRLLEKSGYTVECAAGGLDGIAAYTRDPRAIDLVLLDLSMPGLSGRDVFRELKALDPDVRVLMSSGLRDDPRVVASMDEGVMGFIQKPFRLSVLIAEIERILSAG